MHVGETRPMKVEHELKVNRTEMSFIVWMYGVKAEWKKEKWRTEILTSPPGVHLEGSS